ncbi:MAG: carbon-nitrogen hydrolase family protein [Candidatus Heimdallarchaeota archaeon]|nr:carbon-nitrogen hydrolase family protein [Candidatus Heimdallarchaeota archaeon]
MSELIKIAVAQIAPIYLNIELTVEKAVEKIKEAGENKADLIVFPEAFIPGYPDWVWVVPNYKSAVHNELYSKLLDNAISIPDKYTEILCNAAKEAGIHVIMGVQERNSEASNSSLFNTLIFIDNKGEILGKHRKLIPTGGERLVWAQGDGSTLQVFDTSLGKIGGLICWENYMPLARNAMYAAGAQILVTPTWDKSEKWLQSLQHIAREGGLFVVNCCTPLNKADIPDDLNFKEFYLDEREWINTGNSCVINPKGDIIAGPIKEKEEILYADIDLKQISSSKRLFDVTGHYSRPDVFKFGVNRKPNKNVESIE